MKEVFERFEELLKAYDLYFKDESSYYGAFLSPFAEKHKITIPDLMKWRMGMDFSLEDLIIKCNL